jgi:uncharacterized membrane protein
MDFSTGYSIFIACLGLLGGLSALIGAFINEKKNQARIQEVESEIKKDPEKAKPAWDLARITLESYFNKNLNQITAIFILSILVMITGFAIIIWGVSQAITTPSGIPVAIITACAGVVTEFIGATFLYIFKSTIRQDRKSVV